MMAEPSPSSNTERRVACQRAVAGLMARYAWTLLPEADLIDHVLGAIPSETASPNLERVAITTYVLILHAACRQAEDADLRERGYTDLFRYLYRAAYNRWPHLAEEAVQAALVLIYEQIDRCRSPAAFLQFALYKLLQAAKDVRRRRDKDHVVESLDQITTGDRMYPGEEQDVLDELLLTQERQQVLLDALANLPDRTRKTIVQKYFAGLSDQEIGELLQITVNHVRVIRFQGIQQLRRNNALRAYFKSVTEPTKQSSEEE